MITEYFAVDTGTNAVVAKVDAIDSVVGATEIVVAYTYDEASHPGLVAGHLCYTDGALGDMRKFIGSD